MAGDERSVDAVAREYLAARHGALLALRAGERGRQFEGYLCCAVGTNGQELEAPHYHAERPVAPFITEALAALDDGPPVAPYACAIARVLVRDADGGGMTVVWATIDRRGAVATEPLGIWGLSPDIHPFGAAGYAREGRGIVAARLDPVAGFTLEYVAATAARDAAHPSQRAEVADALAGYDPERQILLGLLLADGMAAILTSIGPTSDDDDDAPTGGRMAAGAMAVIEGLVQAEASQLAEAMLREGNVLMAEDRDGCWALEDEPALPEGVAQRQGVGEFAAMFDDDILPVGGREALSAACETLLTDWAADLVAPARGGALARSLPAALRPGLTPAAARGLYQTLSALAWRLNQPLWLPLATVADFLVWRCLLNEAERQRRGLAPRGRVGLQAWSGVLEATDEWEFGEELSGRDVRAIAGSFPDLASFLGDIMSDTLFRGVPSLDPVDG